MLVKIAEVIVHFYGLVTSPTHTTKSLNIMMRGGKGMPTHRLQRTGPIAVLVCML